MASSVLHLSLGTLLVVVGSISLPPHFLTICWRSLNPYILVSIEVGALWKEIWDCSIKRLFILLTLSSPCQRRSSPMTHVPISSSTILSNLSVSVQVGQTEPSKDMCQQRSNRSSLLCLLLRIVFVVVSGVNSQCTLVWESLRWRTIAHCMDQIMNIDPDALQGLLKRYQKQS